MVLCFLKALRNARVIGCRHRRMRCGQRAAIARPRNARRQHTLTTKKASTLPVKGRARRRESDFGFFRGAPTVSSQRTTSLLPGGCLLSRSPALLCSHGVSARLGHLRPTRRHARRAAEAAGSETCARPPSRRRGSWLSCLLRRPTPKFSLFPL